MAAIDATSAQVTLAKKTKKSGIERTEAKWGLIFISPWLFGFMVFTFFPIIASLIFSMTNYNPIHADQMVFVGLNNYIHMFEDPMIGKSILVTLKFAAISVPLSLALPLGLAVLVNSKNLFAKNVFRTLFYMPYMIPVVAGVVVWGGILNSDSGWLNLFLKNVFGIIGPRWFQDENVPTELYEAATVDGAGGIRKFFSITVPMITPIIFYNLVLALIGSFQYFTQAYIISNGRGDPNFATMFYNLYLYQQSFSYLNMGFGCAMAWAMFIVVLLLTIVLFATSRRWVYYAGGD